MSKGGVYWWSNKCRLVWRCTNRWVGAEMAVWVWIGKVGKAGPVPLSRNKCRLICNLVRVGIGCRSWMGWGVQGLGPVRACIVKEEQVQVSMIVSEDIDGWA